MSRSQRSHATIEELISADVLDGLDELDHTRLEQELARHGPECPECLRLIADFSEVAGRLALTAEPVGMAGNSPVDMCASGRLAMASRFAMNSARSRPRCRRVSGCWLRQAATAYFRTAQRPARVSARS